MPASSPDALRIGHDTQFVAMTGHFLDTVGHARPCRRASTQTCPQILRLNGDGRAMIVQGVIESPDPQDKSR